MDRVAPGARREPARLPSPRWATCTVASAGCDGLVSLAGELDLEAVPAIREAVRDCLQGRPALLRMDIGAVSFCDCSGIGALLWAKGEAARAGIGFHLSGSPQPVVARVLAATGADSQLGLMPVSAEWHGERRESERPYPVRIGAKPIAVRASGVSRSPASGAGGDPSEPTSPAGMRRYTPGVDRLPCMRGVRPAAGVRPPVVWG
ncbi:STAS domain-containing protein [Streptomyces sp. NPDC048550]|uniref:STAS domain-containing protein n=1 Tax=unclassified Streptomyces TaxID=2593676 RepID=UPI003447B8B7